MFTGFSMQDLDRESGLRDKDDLLQSYLQQSSSRIMLWNNEWLVLAGDQSPFFRYPDIADLGPYLSRCLYLGIFQGQRYFTCFVERWHESIDRYQQASLRHIGRQLGEPIDGLLFYAAALSNWHRNHRFCSYCGSDTYIGLAGHARNCNNPDCGRVHYPKIDPAVIFSVVNQTGPESLILLGRQARWDKGRYSVIAGFVEPGESLEDAVRREALEETGLRLHRVSYIASKPWPFPDSLMVGFDCETEDRHIELKDQELEAANWFSASDIEKGVRSGELSMPFKLSISWYLIDRWFRHQTGDTIASLNKGV